MQTSTINQTEIDHFTKDSAKWWDETGPFAPLHKLNPTRLTYLKQQIENRFDSLKNLDILDIGCGGGLVSEPLTRLGASVTGIDGDAQAIQVAKDHAEQNNLKINYLTGDAEQLLKSKKRFDVVLALEIIEHVSNPESFTALLTQLVKPNGIIIMSTLNRTPQSYALGIVAAEYILGWVPKGTHTWSKFLKPSELNSMLRCHNFGITDITGLTYNPISQNFELSNSKVAVNYFITAQKHT